MVSYNLFESAGFGDRMSSIYETESAMNCTRFMKKIIYRRRFVGDMIHVRSLAVLWLLCFDALTWYYNVMGEAKLTGRKNWFLHYIGGFSWPKFVLLFLEVFLFSFFVRRSRAGKTTISLCIGCLIRKYLDAKSSDRRKSEYERDTKAG